MALSPEVIITLSIDRIPAKNSVPIGATTSEQIMLWKLKFGFNVALICRHRWDLWLVVSFSGFRLMTLNVTERIALLREHNYT